MLNIEREECQRDMKEPIVWEAAVPDVTIDEIFRAQGADYSKRSPRPKVIELNQRILQEAAGLVRPTAIWQEVRISGSGEQELFLENGLKLTSKLLARVAGIADNLILMAMTIGSFLEERIAEYNEAGQMLEAFTLDAAGSTFLAKSSVRVFEQIEARYKAEGMTATFPLGPGHSYWSGLNDVRVIINFLKADQIGISLTETNLMVPRKSLAFVMGVGRNLPDFKGKTHCDFCSLQKTCNMRKLGEKCS